MRLGLGSLCKVSISFTQFIPKHVKELLILTQHNVCTSIVQLVILTQNTLCLVLCISFLKYFVVTLRCLTSVPPVVEVLEPPFNSPLQERVANQRIAFPCPAKGTIQFSMSLTFLYVKSILIEHTLSFQTIITELFILIFSNCICILGLPKPVIRWLRNGQELTGNEPGISILEDGTLLLLASLSPLDNGEYTCAAVNDAGSTEKKYQLKVNGDYPS